MGGTAWRGHDWRMLENVTPSHVAGPQAGRAATYAAVVGHRAYLVGGHTPEPARPLWHTDNFDPDRFTDILAGCKYSIPLIWLLCSGCSASNPKA